MTEAEVLAEINESIVPNNNQEITANVLRPILVNILEQPNDRIDTVNFNYQNLQYDVEQLEEEAITEQDVQDTPRAFSAGQALDAVPTTDGSVTLDLSQGNYFPVTIEENTTFNAVTQINSKAQSFVLHITVGGAGGFSVDFHSSWKWHNDEMPDLPNITGDRYSLYGFVFPDNTVEVSLFNRMPL